MGIEISYYVYQTPVDQQGKTVIQSTSYGQTRERNVQIDGGSTQTLSRRLYHVQSRGTPRLQCCRRTMFTGCTGSLSITIGLCWKSWIGRQANNANGHGASAVDRVRLGTVDVNYPSPSVDCGLEQSMLTLLPQWTAA